MHSKSKISKSIGRYKLSRRFYDLVTILLGYKARCCALWCALNHLSTVMYKSDTAAKRCATRCPGCGSPAAAPGSRGTCATSSCHAAWSVARPLGPSSRCAVAHGSFLDLWRIADHLENAARNAYSWFYVHRENLPLLSGWPTYIPNSATRYARRPAVAIILYGVMLVAVLIINITGSSQTAAGVVAMIPDISYDYQVSLSWPPSDVS